jgi:thymidylate synthase (FAD)
MIIVPQSIAIETVDGLPINGPAVLKFIERIGRVCYRSECRITDDSAATFVKRLIDSKHESVIEHYSITVRVICDRGISHEIVRHRIAAYSQESTRYCNYGKVGEITVIEPPGMTSEQRGYWAASVLVAEDSYVKMLAAGCTPQIARSVLPTCLKTEIVATYNLRQWRHFFRMRTALAAHPQIREVAGWALAEFKRTIPIVFDDIVIAEPAKVA